MTVPTMPAALVAAPPRTPLPYGLFSVVPFRTGDRWEAGVEFEQLGCGPLSGIGHGGFCADPDTVTGLPRRFERSPQGIGGASPFAVVASHRCAPVANSAAQARLLAQQRLLLGEESAVERVFATGELGNTPNLTQAEPVTAGAVSPAVGVALLEEWIGDSGFGQGIIHLPRAVAALAGLKTTGQTLRTALGTPVVAGAGYSGATPDGTQPSGVARWAFATPPMIGYRSDPTVTDMFDHAINDQAAYAERDYLLAVEDCGMAAVLIDPGAGSGGGGAAFSVDPDNPDLLVLK